ncbi:rRNA-processing protein [Martiniozyma asiatica (nom. inval.)]|nr:rRNA-processing protein [Martiniozyma asiatica]
MTTINSKKIKLSSSGNKELIRKSRIFSPFRVIGHVSNGTPFSIGSLGSTFYIVTVVGRSFQIYDAATLHLLFVSNTQTTAPITAVTSHYHYIYCAYGNKIGVFRRGKLQFEMKIPENDTKINKLVMFGNYLVASTDHQIHVFEKKEQSDKFPSIFYTTITVNSIYGNIIDMIHMPTYLNKIVIATPMHVMIYNIKTAKLIYTTEEFTENITCISSAPALDFIAIGNTQGLFRLFNLKKGKALKTINTGSSSSITSLSFRTDGTPHVVASLRNGDLFFYDLNKNSRVHVLANAHREEFGGITKVEFLNGQPIVVTTGGDNTIKEYVFDPVLSETNTSVVSPPRHLRSRGGHSAPPTSIVFADENTHFIQSGSQDRSFWSFSLRKDAQSQEISQRESKVKQGKLQAGLSSKFKSKFPPIISLAQENARVGEWDNIITAHQDEPFARTWNSRFKKIGKHKLSTIDNGSAKCVAMSSCGNFGFVGSSEGGIGVYNLQSGILRKKYKLHKKTVTGIALDGMNRKMVSCGLDGIVGFYDFSESKYLGKLTFDSPITQLVYHRSSDLFAIALDDLSIIIIDSVTQKVVRQLFGHTNRITAMDFSHDGRWIVSAALDSTIRTWDLPTGGCIDGIKLPKVATCLKMSPNGEYLATTHANDVGISLWTNKSQFHPISTRHVEDEEEFANILLPNVSGEGGSSMIEGALADPVELDEDSGTYISPEELNDKLLTFSHQSHTKFSTLVHLDSIKSRNKPQEAPKKPENLPFFLELTGLKVGNGAIENELGKDVVEKMNKKSDDTNGNSRLMKLNKNKEYEFETEFTKLLRLSEFDKWVSLIVNMSPANLDFEIKSMTVTTPFKELVSFFRAISWGLDKERNVEILVAVMFMFLNSHSDILASIEDENVWEVINSWRSINQSKLDRLDKAGKYCRSVLALIN